MKQSLCKEKWYLKGFWPYTPLQGKSMETGSELAGNTDWLEATVPGGVHYDLYRHGLIENPYTGFHAPQCEWVEHRWWMYRTEFQVDLSQRARLVFCGLDYHARVYINDRFVAESENMYVPLKIDLKHLAKPTVEVKVLLMGIPQEMGQVGYTSRTTTQKSRFNYKWDFSTRLVNIGIWDEVYLEYGDVFLEEAEIRTDVSEGIGKICADFEVCGIAREAFQFRLFDPNGRELSRKSCETAREEWEIVNPRLWYPNGLGESALYTLQICGNGLDESYRVGIRSISYRQNPGSPSDSLPYTVVINGKAVFLKGINMVPLDHLYGNVTVENYEYYVQAMAKANINLVRVWGGGLIEKEIFYDLCDRYGILVWQDFIQSSSGIENIPSSDSAFLSKLQATAEYAVKTKRNHVSMAVWCGGNELMWKNYLAVDEAHENIAMLKSVVEEHDFGKLFLPGTPSGTEFFISDTGENHDVHGNWKYSGNPDYYCFYNKAKSLIHTEFGADGFSANFKRFAEGFYTDDITCIQNDWLNFRNGDWWDSRPRDEKIFGVIHDTDSYILCSQWIQAEAVRYAVEADLRQRPRNSGCMIWQLNEPWPNLGCTCLIDHFGQPKMAYYWTKSAYEKDSVSLVYDRLNFEEFFEAEVVCEKETELTLSLYDLDGTLRECRSLKTSREKLRADVTQITKGFFIRLEWNRKSKDYYFSKSETTPYRCYLNLPSAKLEMISFSFDSERGIGQTEIVNRGSQTAYFVHLWDKQGENAVLCDDCYFTLLPQETRKVSFFIRRDAPIFFGKKDKFVPEVRCLNGRKA